MKITLMWTSFVPVFQFLLLFLIAWLVVSIVADIWSESKPSKWYVNLLGLCIIAFIVSLFLK